MNKVRNFAIVMMLFLMQGCAHQSNLLSQTIKDANNGDKTALHKLCYGYLRGKDFEQDYVKALEWCTRAANSNIPSSQTLLAEMYYLGLGMEKNYDIALHWYTKAAMNNHPHAQYVLGLLYIEDSKNDKQKYQEGLAWLRKAASNGHEKAKQKLKKIREENAYRNAAKKFRRAMQNNLLPSN